MKTDKATALSAVFILSLSGMVHAEEDPFQFVNLGFGVDQGDLSITGSLGRFNGFASNEGMALDVIFSKGRFNKNWPIYVYVGGGGFVSRDNDFAARLPVGLEVTLGKSWNIYAQLIPSKQLSTPHESELIVGYGLRFQY